VELHEAQTLALALMTEHGLRDNAKFATKDFWSFAFDNRKRRVGACHYGKRLITLSRPIVILNTEAEIRDTILHEIAHAKAEGSGHGIIWQVMAQSIGARPVRCAGHDVKTPEGRWQAQCPQCKIVCHKYARPRTAKRQSCGICAPRFDSRFLLVYKFVETDRTP
jgi:predicted SprT family Zn-dependent metalloprotease